MTDRPTEATAAFVQERTELAKQHIEEAADALRSVLAERVVQNGVRGSCEAILAKLNALNDDGSSSLFLKMEQAAHAAYGPRAGDKGNDT